MVSGNVQLNADGTFKTMLHFSTDADGNQQSGDAVASGTYELEGGEVKFYGPDGEVAVVGWVENGSLTVDLATAFSTNEYEFSK